MALVRCPTHKIPYNDENPRGCPACAREEEGENSGNIMQELARAQAKRSTKSQPKRSGDNKKPTTARKRRPSRTVTPHPFVAATQRPKVPVVHESWLQRVSRISGQRRFIPFGAVIITVLFVGLFVFNRPQFAEVSIPAVVSQSELRPLPIDPNRDIQLAFAALGSQPPRANPIDPSLMQYRYGDDLLIDARNSRIYAITLRVPNRSWKGIWTGMPRQRALGELAMLAAPDSLTFSNPAPTEVRGYQTYASLESRPRLIYRADVRPPNGCFDVELLVQPRVIGLIHRGDERLAAVARAGRPPEWVVTQIRVFSRSIPGPYADGVACR